MRSKQIADDPKICVIVLNAGNELLSSLKSFAKAQCLSAGSFKAIVL
jgi:hypothetical protein